MSTTSIERQVLGALMQDSERAAAVLTLTPECFTDPTHREIWDESKKLLDSGESVTPFTLPEKHQALAMELIGDVVTMEGIESHCRILRSKEAERFTRNTLITLDERMRNEEIDVKSTIETLEGCINRLYEAKEKKQLRHVSEGCAEFLHEQEAIIAGKVMGLKTGFQTLDENGWWLENGTVTVLAGRPGMGKSAFALELAIKANVNTAFFSLEMNEKSLISRLLSVFSGISARELWTPDVIRNRVNSIIEAAGRAAKTKIWIDDTGGKSPREAIAQCKRLRARHGLGFAIFDYAQKMRSGEKNWQKRDELDSISDQVLNMAKSMDIPVLLISQLNRECETREDKRPILRDLKESGSLEQDAHMVWMMYRDEVYNPKTTKWPGIAEVIVRKCRNNKLGAARLNFDAANVRFTDYLP